MQCRFGPISFQIATLASGLYEIKWAACMAPQVRGCFWRIRSSGRPIRRANVLAPVPPKSPTEIFLSLEPRAIANRLYQSEKNQRLVNSEKKRKVFLRRKRCHYPNSSSNARGIEAVYQLKTCRSRHQTQGEIFTTPPSHQQQHARSDQEKKGHAGGGRRR